MPAAESVRRRKAGVLVVGAGDYLHRPLTRSELAVSSPPGAGTTVRAVLPL
jgi:hypothetical protein